AINSMSRSISKSASDWPHTWPAYNSPISGMTYRLKRIAESYLWCCTQSGVKSCCCVQGNMLPTESKSGMLLERIDRQAATQVQEIPDGVFHANMSSQRMGETIDHFSHDNNRGKRIADSGFHVSRYYSIHTWFVACTTHIGILQTNKGIFWQTILHANVHRYR